MNGNDMLLVSSHILDCNEVKLPDDVVIRVNLAWLAGYNMACMKLEQIKYDIFLDNPIDRVKPPSNKYTMSDIVCLINKFPNIKYLAVSNVEHGVDLVPFQIAIYPSHVKIVPKIETIEGIKNIQNIVDIIYCVNSIPLIVSMNYIMLDHDDLCSDLIRNGVDPSLMYIDYINPLIKFCKANNINLLRTQGVIFSTEY